MNCGTLCNFLNHVRSVAFAKGELQVLEPAQDNQSKQDAPELHLVRLSQGSEYLAKDS